MFAKNEMKKFIIGFFHPGLLPVYVLLASSSGIVFVTCYYGYGCWYRVGGILFLLFVPVAFVLLLMVICAGRLQRIVWTRLLGQPNTGEIEMSLGELFWRSCLVAIIAPILFAK